MIRRCITTLNDIIRREHVPREPEIRFLLKSLNIEFPERGSNEVSEVSQSEDESMESEESTDDEEVNEEAETKEGQKSEAEAGSSSAEKVGHEAVPVATSVRENSGTEALCESMKSLALEGEVGQAPRAEEGEAVQKPSIDAGILVYIFTSHLAVQKPDLYSVQISVFMFSLFLKHQTFKTKVF